MHYTAFLPFALLPLAIAAPTPTELVARSCTTILPKSYQQISERQPTTVFPQNRFFSISQDAPGNHDFDSLVRFSGIPAGSYGCTLGVSFFPTFAVKSSGSTLINVYALPGDITPSDTYSKYFPTGGRGRPANAVFFGTMTLTTAGPQGEHFVINSEVCHPNLNFLFEIASDTAAGAVSFQDQGDNLTGIAGFYMSFNC